MHCNAAAIGTQLELSALVKQLKDDEMPNMKSLFRLYVDVEAHHRLKSHLNPSSENFS